MNIEQRLCEQTNFGLPTSPEKLTQEKLAFEAEIDLTYMRGFERARRY
jgi:hypothetical protein